MTDGHAGAVFELLGLRDQGARVALSAGGDEACHQHLDKNTNIFLSHFCRRNSGNTWRRTPGLPCLTPPDSLSWSSCHPLLCSSPKLNSPYLNKKSWYHPAHDNCTMCYTNIFMDFCVLMADNGPMNNRICYQNDCKNKTIIFTHTGQQYLLARKTANNWLGWR